LHFIKVLIINKWQNITSFCLSDSHVKYHVKIERYISWRGLNFVVATCLILIWIPFIFTQSAQYADVENYPWLLNLSFLECLLGSRLIKRSKKHSNQKTPSSDLLSSPIVSTRTPHHNSAKKKEKQQGSTQQHTRPPRWQHHKKNSRGQHQRHLILNLPPPLYFLIIPLYRSRIHPHPSYIPCPAFTSPPFPSPAPSSSPTPAPSTPLATEGFTRTRARHHTSVQRQMAAGGAARRSVCICFRFFFVYFGSLM